MRSPSLHRPALSALSIVTCILASAFASEARAQQQQPAPLPAVPPPPPVVLPPPTNPQPAQPVSPSATSAGGSVDISAQAPGNVASPAATPAVQTQNGSTSDVDATATAGARAVGAAPPAPAWGNFMDTRLTWTFGDDDFLHKTGEAIPLSPTFNIGDRSQYRLFFDNLNSKYNGRENLTHLVMYKKLPGFIDGLTTEAAMALRFDLASLAANTGNLNGALQDAGSYIRIFYNTNTSKPKEGVEAVFFPLDTDRFRLGYLYNISWGGTNGSLNESIFPRIVGSSPGMKIQYNHEKFYAFGGFKTATINQPERVLNPGGENDVETVRVGETNFGFLGGVGGDPLPNLHLDAGAGYFQQGKFDLEDVRGRPIYTYGASGRVVVHHNMPVPVSVDFLLYRNDPSAPMIMFAPQQYKPHDVSWSVSAEATVLEQHLKSYQTLGATENQAAYAGALQGVVKAGYARFSITGIMRNLNYVVRNVPGFIPFETLPQNVKTDPEMFGAIAADYYIESLRLTPQIGGGVQLPSTFKSEFTEGAVPASRTVVVRSQGDESILPFDKNRSPIIQARASVRWNISEILSTLAWAQIVRDNNGTLIVRDPTEGTASLRVYQSPTHFGLGVSLQARF